MKSALLSRELAALGLDLGGTLREEPRFLTDASFIGALHMELRERLGPGDARAALLQLGFLHGLRDALELITRGLRLNSRAAGGARPRLSLALDGAQRERGEPLRGAFRDGIEARAVASGLGVQSEAACALTSGYASGWLSGLFDSDLLVVERSCAACGAARCEFEARTPEDWAAAGDEAADGDVGRLPFSPLRDLVARHLAGQPEPAGDPKASSLESDAPVIHVWGPVMVIPYSGANETISGLDLIRRDAGAKEVRVVVVDLASAIIDESFGALELERVLESIERLGAEPILTGISPLSERAVADLEISHLVVRKDLPAAIAAAFQIADATRRTV
ncbi:MAG TPA: V4R domain-containing protein [Myxococcota bacterium]|nr:V4R domain-containing protein [Myxococcota bacterium]